MNAPSRKPASQSKTEPLPVSLIRRAREFGGHAFGTPIAVMLMLRELTDAQYQAAADYERAYVDYMHAMGLRLPQTAKLEFGAISHQPDPDSPHGQTLGRREAILIDRYNERHRVVVSCGMDAARDFEAVVCAGFQPTWHMKQSVIRVCDALAKTRPRRRDARGDGRSRAMRSKR